ncbi:uncharacterized protein LOC123722324 [Papilio machaon]|uniref:uncharacterized protein LOC123722324 n=1 Tax=Papilio machaon TaxID=76193 RepID=UPI001E662E1C|nr:uncharacterized protein LOC123722324 [Papilio machaon]
MVESELPIVNTFTLPSSNSFSGNRCFRPSLGGTTERPSDLGKLVPRRTTATLESERDAGHFTRPPDPCSFIEAQLAAHTVRQQDCSRSITERRRYEIHITNEHNLPNFEIIRPSQNTLQHSLHSGQVQQSCRPPFASPSTSRVAPTTDLCGNGVCEMGYSSDRFIRFENCSRSVQLCLSGFERSPSSLSRCVQCSMGLSTCVGISPAVLNPQSSGTPESVNRNILDSSSTVGESVLARRPQSPIPRSPVHSEQFAQSSDRHINGASTAESRIHDARSLEMWGWTEAIKSWNIDQLSLLKNSWRKSTLKTYEVAWKRWTLWCKDKNVNPKNPTGAQLAQFLSDLYLIHKLSYNTILLHKSVVSTLCNSETSSQLSSHVLVKHICKSIALKVPKISKAPIWDVSKLSSFLANYTIDINNVYQTSRHTALLLLLCSGRRVHDLTLLRVDPEHFVMAEHSVVFWPEFGSKTDNNDYRQSGWKLISNTNNRNLNPVFWVEKTVALLNERRDTAKSFKLFITVRGIAKPASRTVISGWIKTLFKEAGITATPGSVRSAVASKNWLENTPIDEILTRGNWRSANTFHKFYRREVMKTQDSQNVAQLFTPAN